MFVYSLFFSFAVSTTSIDVGKTDAIRSTHGHLTVNVNGRGDRHTRSQLTDTSQSTKSHPTATILPVLHSRRGHTVPWPSTPSRRNPEVPTFGHLNHLSKIRLCYLTSTLAPWQKTTLLCHQQQVLV